MAKLFMIRLWNSICGKKLAVRNRLTDMYKEGKKRIDKSLDIVGLIKDIKYLKLLTMFKLDPDIET